MVNSENKAEVLKAIKYGMADDVICDLEDVTPDELAKIKAEVQTNA